MNDKQAMNEDDNNHADTQQPTLWSDAFQAERGGVILTQAMNEQWMNKDKWTTINEWTINELTMNEQ